LNNNANPTTTALHHFPTVRATILRLVPSIDRPTNSLKQQ
jgi:hypothetical protein